MPQVDYLVDSQVQIEFEGQLLSQLVLITNITPMASGHEKLNAQALGMGGVGLNIYGIKDQWSSFLLHLAVLANHWFVTLFGIDIKEVIQQGKVSGVYNPGNPIHPCVVSFTLSHLTG